MTTWRTPAVLTPAATKTRQVSVNQVLIDCVRDVMKLYTLPASQAQRLQTARRS